MDVGCWWRWCEPKARSSCGARTMFKYYNLPFRVVNGRHPTSDTGHRKAKSDEVSQVLDVGVPKKRWNTVLFGESWWIQIWPVNSWGLQKDPSAGDQQPQLATKKKPDGFGAWLAAPNAQRILSWFCKNYLHSNDKHGKMIIFQTWFWVFHVKKKGSSINNSIAAIQVKSTTPMSSWRRWCLGSLEGPWRKRRWCGRSVSPMYLGSAGRELFILRVDMVDGRVANEFVGTCFPCYAGMLGDPRAQLSESKTYQGVAKESNLRALGDCHMVMMAHKIRQYLDSRSHLKFINSPMSWHNFE